MATTIIAADATIVTTGSLLLGGKQFDFSFTKVLSSCTQAFKEIVNVPASEVDIFGLTGAAIDKGTFLDFNFFIIINRDDTNFARLRWLETGGDTVDFKLEAGDFMMLNNSNVEVNTTGGAFAAFVTLDTVAIQADTAPVDIEMIAYKI